MNHSPSDLVVHRDPEILSGVPVFVGTRVPVDALIDWVEGGYTVDEFVDSFPTVSRAQAAAFLHQAMDALLARLPPVPDARTGAGPHA